LSIPITFAATAARSAEVVNAHLPARPFLKWAGGKRQLLPQLRRFVPSTFRAYFEPFIGSGALFFDLVNSRTVMEHGARLTDVNRDLVGCYRTIARDVDAVIASLRQHAILHRRSPAEHYYRVRDQQFNPARRRLFDGNHADCSSFEYPPHVAAMFIYLNRTGFNGLYRLNSRGDFNVPAGRYANPLICDAANLRTVSAVLGAPSVGVRYGSFATVLDEARSGDLLYFDPPYAPLTATSNFTSYTALGFSADDQRHLQEVVVELAGRGCHVIVSNSTAPLITALYEKNRTAKRAGLRAYKVAARRAINSDAARRGEIAEYIISNVTPSA
jgi:DNA adenine methylase